MRLGAVSNAEAVSFSLRRSRGLGRIDCWPGRRASNSKATRPLAEAAKNSGPIGESIFVESTVSMGGFLGEYHTRGFVEGVERRAFTTAGTEEHRVEQDGFLGRSTG